MPLTIEVWSSCNRLLLFCRFQVEGGSANLCCRWSTGSLCRGDCCRGARTRWGRWRLSHWYNRLARLGLEHRRRWCRRGQRFFLCLRHFYFFDWFRCAGLACDEFRHADPFFLGCGWNDHTSDSLVRLDLHLARNSSDRSALDSHLHK